MGFLLALTTMEEAMKRRWKYTPYKKKGLVKAHLVPDWDKAWWLEAKCGMTSDEWLPLIPKGCSIKDFAPRVFCKKCLGDRKLPRWGDDLA